MEELLTTAYHEFDANLLFTEYALQPFYALESVVRRHDGSRRTTLEFDGDPFWVQLRYSASGIGALNHPSSDLRTIREYHIDFRREDDVGQCSGSFHVAPRTPDMVDEDGEPISVPDVVGINVRAQGSNLPFGDYLPLLQEAFVALGLDPDYVADPHQYSNVQDAARYVRVHLDESGPIHAVDGPIARISNLLADDRSGYRKHVADDTETPGYYHTATVGPDRAGELVPQHRLAKEVKHYHPRDPDAFDEDHPLAHPKLECSLQISRMDDSVDWSDLSRVERELDEVVLNVLAWTRFPVVDGDDPLGALDEDDADDQDDGDEDDGDPWGPIDDSPYVADEYWVPATAPRQRRIVRDPTPEIADRQESIVIRHLVDGLEESDWDTLDRLVADGGEVSPADLADDTGYRLGTIYRAIDRLEGLVEHSYGELSLRSHHVAQQVAEAVERAREAGQDAVVTAAKALEAERGMELANDALVKWVDEFGVEIEDRRDAQLMIRAGEFDGKREAYERLWDGYQTWIQSGWDADEFWSAALRFRTATKTFVYQTAGDFLEVPPPAR